MQNKPRPFFSLVSAVYDVRKYLPDFIASVEAQTFSLDRVEVIMVDDGSTDDSLDLLRAWQERRPGLVSVVTQPNAGQAAARNSGMALALGEWISFPDPDDVLQRDYLASIAQFVAANSAVDLVAAHRLMWFEGSPPVNKHPLRQLFARDRLVDLSRDPAYFHGHAPSGFFRLDRVRELDLTFDVRVRPNFEDGHFTCRYALSYENPQVGFVGSAKYHYRRRSDRSSTLQSARSDVRRYTDVFDYGFLDITHHAQERFGKIPGWLQNLLVHEMSQYFRLTDSKAPMGAPTVGPVADRLHAAMAEVLSAIDLDEAVPNATSPLTQVQRLVLQHGYRTHPWNEPFALLGRLDKRQKLVQASWYFTGPAAEEVFRADGEPVSPLHVKTRNFDFCGRTLLQERIAWLPANRVLEIRLDGSPLELVFRRPPVAVRQAWPGRIRWELSKSSSRNTNLLAEVVNPVPHTREGKRAQRSARRPKVQAKYRGAWVLMDRIHNAGDSAEILFRHIRAEHPDINAWFVLEKGNPEWERLSGEGYGKRLVPHGSMQWRLLMANATHLISSHADSAVVAPEAILEFAHPGWKYHFLNHGVIKDDLSSWLNPKDMDTFVTSSRQEYASIAGDLTPYKFTTREVQLTGMPRFDRLLEIGNRYPPETRDLLLVAPTWRKGLLPPPQQGTQRWGSDPAALDSEFVRQWQSFLAHPALAAACAQHQLTIGFLPHPNLEPLLPMLDLPTNVQLLTYDGNDVQEYFARARALVTDFSSVAFNAAYLERPVVYFQFDEDVVRDGGHVGRAGYFDYRRDGFGPVATTATAALEAVTEALAHGPRPKTDYLARIEATFPLRDGRCSARVVEAIRETTRPQASADPTPTPVMPPPALASDGSRA